MEIAVRQFVHTVKTYMDETGLTVFECTALVEKAIRATALHRKFCSDVAVLFIAPLMNQKGERPHVLLFLLVEGRERVVAPLLILPGRAETQDLPDEIVKSLDEAIKEALDAIERVMT